MNKNLKFKLYDKKKNEIVNYVDCSISIADGGVQSFNKDGIMQGTLNNRHLIPIQYAGKKDRNGIEIYQGFIVKRIDRVTKEHVITGAVTFKNCSWWIENKIENRKVLLFTLSPVDTVVGNIYQDKELAREIGYEFKGEIENG